MSNINLGSGLPETVLDSEPESAQAALAAALRTESDNRRDAVSVVVGQWPQFLAGWASLGDLARDDVEAYAAYRVGYHRGLDRLRQSGWRGSGFVRWEQPTNRGFLRSLDGLRRAAAAIGETPEAERCQIFLAQLDPAWDGPALDNAAPDGPALDNTALDNTALDNTALDTTAPDSSD